MNVLFFVIFLIGITSKVVSENMKSAKFTTKSAEQQNAIIMYMYKRVKSSYFGRRKRISQLQCAKVCMNKDHCKSVYVDGEACVFGVDDVTAFEEG